MSTSTLAHPAPTGSSYPSPKPSTPAVPDTDPERCALLGPTALFVQGLMGVLVLASLIAKRQLERRKRPWRIWAFDVSKQLFGQGFVHASNVFISALVAHLSSDNPCAFYFLNVLVDTTLGVFIIYLSLHLYEYVLIKTFALSPNFKSGAYGSPPRVHNWARQLVPYLSALITMKVCVVLLFALFPGPFVRFGNWVLDWMSATSQVVFVMMIFPLVMNVLQFCLVDQILKSSMDLDAIKLPNSATGSGTGAYERLPATAREEEEGLATGVSRSSIDAGSRRRSFGILYPNETTPIPSSPLLGPEDKDRSGYGSATSSPRKNGGISGLELPASVGYGAGAMVEQKKRPKSALALARDEDDFEVRLVLGGSIELGMPKDFTRNGIDQGKVVFSDPSGAVLEIYKLSVEAERDGRKLHDRLLHPVRAHAMITESIILPSPFQPKQVTTATIIRVRDEESIKAAAILADGRDSTTKLIFRLNAPADARIASCFEAIAASIRIVDDHAWLSCQASDLESAELRGNVV